MKNMIIVCVKSKKIYDMIFRDCDSSRKREINKKKREGAAVEARQAAAAA